MRKEVLKKIGILAAVAAVLIILYFCSGKLIAMIKDVDSLKKWLNGFGIFNYLVFVLLVSMQVIVAIIPGGLYQVAGGYIYGTILGSALCVIGCSIGSMIVFLLVRRYGIRFIRLFISEDSLNKTKFITESPKCRLLLTICFIIPGTPKDVISYIAGLTNITFFQWLFICSLGRLPGIFLSVFAGNAFSSNHYGRAILAFCLLAVICFFGALAYKKLKQQE